MSLIFTCGHKGTPDDNGFTISSKAFTRENNKAVDYRTVCRQCYNFYEAEDLILFGEAAEEKWLNE
jgi:hypothetical protein